MRLRHVLSLSTLLLVGCETVPDNMTRHEEARERCDTVLTGSRIPQCNRGDVRTISREELERSPPSWNTTNANNPEGMSLPGR